MLVCGVPDYMTEGWMGGCRNRGLAMGDWRAISHALWGFDNPHRSTMVVRTMGTLMVCPLCYIRRVLNLSWKRVLCVLTLLD